MHKYLMRFLSFLNYKYILISILTGVKFGVIIILSVYRVLTVIGIAKNRWSTFLAPYLVTGSFRMIFKMSIPLCKVQVYRLLALVN